MLLDVVSDAGFPEIRRKSRLLDDELRSLARAPLTPDSRDRLRRLQEKAQHALWILGDPSRRAEHDANKGNDRAVARCIAAGLTVSEMNRLRAAFLADHPRHDRRAQAYRIAGDLHASRGEPDAALREYEKALMLDPLNLEVQRGFRALRRTRAMG